MDFYRGATYTIEWIDGIAHFTIYLRGNVFRGEGNHGDVKDLIDHYYMLTD